MQRFVYSFYTHYTCEWLRLLHFRLWVNFQHLLVSPIYSLWFEYTNSHTVQSIHQYQADKIHLHIIFTSFPASIPHVSTFRSVLGLAVSKNFCIKTVGTTTGCKPFTLPSKLPILVKWSNTAGFVLLSKLGVDGRTDLMNGNQTWKSLLI